MVTEPESEPDSDELDPPTTAILHNIDVPADAPAIRVDRFLAGVLPALSRSRIQQLIDDARVHIDGAAARQSDKIKPGQHIVVEEPAPVSVATRPEPIPIDVLFEDA